MKALAAPVEERATRMKGTVAQSPLPRASGLEIMRTARFVGGLREAGYVNTFDFGLVPSLKPPVWYSILALMYGKLISPSCGRSTRAMYGSGVCLVKRAV